MSLVYFLPRWKPLRITPTNYTLMPISTLSYANYLGAVIKSCKTCNA
jgi:hypothetical protein